MAIQFFVRESLDYFLQPNVLPKLSKVPVACPKLIKWTHKVNFDFPKVNKTTINLEMLKSVMKKLETSNLDSR